MAKLLLIPPKAKYKLLVIFGENLLSFILLLIPKSRVQKIFLQLKLML